MIMLALIGSLMTVFLNYYTTSMAVFPVTTKPWRTTRTNRNRPKSRQQNGSSRRARMATSSNPPEVTTFILLGGGTLAIAMFGKYTAMGLARSLSLFLQQPDPMSVDGAGLAAMIARSVAADRLGAGAFFAVMIAAGLAGHVLQSRPGISFDKITPDFSKVSSHGRLQAHVRRSKAG